MQKAGDTHLALCICCLELRCFLVTVLSPKWQIGDLGGWLCLADMLNLGHTVVFKMNLIPSL